MTRKVYATVTFSMIVTLDEGTELFEVLSELDCNFSDTTGNPEANKSSKV